MNPNAYLIQAPLAIALALLLRFTAIRFAGAEKPSHRLRLSLMMLLLVTIAHADLLYIILDNTGMMAAFGPAVVALLLAALLSGCVIFLCYTLRRKRSLTEAQKMELNAM